MARAGCSEIGEEGEIAVYNPRSGQRKLFKFDKVFGVDSTQDDVYEDTKALIRSVLDGQSVAPHHCHLSTHRSKLVLQKNLLCFAPGGSMCPCSPP